jgi:hypothetical protein
MTLKNLYEQSKKSIMAISTNWYMYIAFFILVNIFHLYLMPMKEVAMVPNIILEIISGIVSFFFAYDCFEKNQGFQNNLRATWSEAMSRMPRVIFIAIAYSLLFFVGMIAFVIPGIIIVALFGLAPLVPLFEPGTAKPFKRSKELVLKAPYLAAPILIIFTLYEFLPLLTQGLKLSNFAKFPLMMATDLFGLILVSISVSLYYLLLKSK